MCNTMKIFYQNVIKRVSYWFPLLFFTVVAYGFSTFNPTVSIDDMAREYYLGDGNAMISATRWGMVLWTRLFSTVQYIPGLDHLIGVSLLIFGAVFYSAVLFFLSEDKKYSMKYMIFSALMITYPLINEIWEYNGANMIVAGNLLLVGVIHLYWLTSNQSWLKKSVVSGIILSVVVSSYETGVFVYITMVFLVLFCKYFINNEVSKKAEWLKEGSAYILPLVIAIVLRVVIGLLLIKIMGLSFYVNGDTSIKWGVYSIGQFVKAFIFYYLTNGLVYFPITVFVFAAVGFVGFILMKSIKQGSVLPCLLGFLLLISLFGQTLVQGFAMPYRTAHTLVVFISFVGYLFIENTEKSLKNKKYWYKVALVLSLFVCFRQAVYLNSILTLNHLRSENEQAMVCQIGYHLQSEYEDKDLVFVGKYSVGKYINEQVLVDESTWRGRVFYKLMPSVVRDYPYKYLTTNINSCLNWSKEAFGNQYMMEKYFNYCGFDVHVVEEFTKEFYEENIQIATENGMKPYEIKDMGDYLIVCIGAL